MRLLASTARRQPFNYVDVAKKLFKITIFVQCPPTCYMFLINEFHYSLTIMSFRTHLCEDKIIPLSCLLASVEVELPGLCA